MAVGQVVRAGRRQERCHCCPPLDPCLLPLCAQAVFVGPSCASVVPAVYWALLDAQAVGSLAASSPFEITSSVPCEVRGRPG
jgi:hypothetical protein